jgi:hypothetical protein
MSEILMTGWFRFLGMNIKGTPAMRYEFVAHDLRVAKRKADVVVVQEFRWTWYWKALRNTLTGKDKADPLWGFSPGVKAGARNPVKGAQGAFWNRSMWKRLDTMVRLLHWGAAKISENRFMRAVLLSYRGTDFVCWFFTTHFVVKGDEKRDPAKRRKMMDTDLDNMTRMLKKMVATGHPIMGQLDANIHKGSEVYDRFIAMVKAHGGKFHGDLGIEFLFTIDGRDVRIEVKDDWIVPTSEVHTDHEGRGITARLVAKRAA